MLDLRTCCVLEPWMEGQTGSRRHVWPYESFHLATHCYYTDTALDGFGSRRAYISAYIRSVSGERKTRNQHHASANSNEEHGSRKTEHDTSTAGQVYHRRSKKCQVGAWTTVTGTVMIQSAVVSNIPDCVACSGVPLPAAIFRSSERAQVPALRCDLMLISDMLI